MLTVLLERCYHAKAWNAHNWAAWLLPWLTGVEISPGGPWYCEYEEHGEYRRGWRIVERHSARAFVIPAPDYSERDALAICVALNGVQHD